MTKEEARAQFIKHVLCEEHKLQLDRAALLIAAEEYPRLDLDAYLAYFDWFGYEAYQRNNPQDKPLRRLEQLNDYLFGVAGFYGNTANYFDARNSFLNEVIDRRTGIPLTLSLIYLETARRLRLPVYGVGLPGHFIVKYVGARSDILLDPFYGGRRLNRKDCARLVAESSQGKLRFQPWMLQTVTKKQILLRMLQNLKGIYAQAGDHYKLLGVIERSMMLNAGSVEELRDRGLAYAGLRNYRRAIADLEGYLRYAPHASDLHLVKGHLAKLRLQQAQLN